jgi:DNA-binding MarR family transcriptional regulator
MITRESNPADGRGALIGLTDKAQATTTPILRAVLAVENDLIGTLPSGGRDVLTAKLRSLLSSPESADLI